MMAFLMIFTFAFIAKAEPFHVVIDPGHGGVDHGAVRDKIREADITLKVSQFLVDSLEKDSDFQVTTTRTQDEIVPLNVRAKIGAQSKGQLFLSIHANSSPDSRANGTEFYFQSQMSLKEEELYLANSETHSFNKNTVEAIINDLVRTYNNYQSQILAETLQNHWKQSLKVRDRPILQESFRVLVNVPMPSVLVELGFISNKKERTWMNETTSQKYMADLLYNGIKEFKEKIDKSPLSGHIVSHANR